MRLYIEFVKMAFQANIAYRMKVFLNTLHMIVWIFIQVSIWYALINTKTIALDGAGSINLRDMVTYTVISIAISMVVDCTAQDVIEHKITSGEIATDLVKPMNFKIYMIAQGIGNSIFTVVFQIIPLLVVSALIFGLDLPRVENVPWFILSFLNAYVINFLITYIIGQASFWLMKTWYFDRLLNDAYKLFSGRLIPLWFFPSFLITISDYLPLKHVYFSPITIYLNKMNGSQSLNIIIQQLIWILILGGITEFMWHRGTKKVAIQGG